MADKNKTLHLAAVGTNAYEALEAMTKIVTKLR